MILASKQPAQIQAAKGDGKLLTFDGIAYTGRRMRPQNWTSDVVIDLQGIKISSQHRPVLRQHDPGDLVGHTNSVRVTSRGIEIAGVFSGHPDRTAEVIEPAKNGFQWQLSVGANPTRLEYLEPGEDATINGMTMTGPLTISRETELGEVSFVPLGADQDTSVSVNFSGSPASKTAKASASRSTPSAPRIAVQTLAASAGPRDAYGTACRFGVGASMHCGNEVVLAAFSAKAFDVQLFEEDRIVALRLGHGGKVLATTRDALVIKKEGDTLAVKITGSTEQSRAAIEEIRASGWTGLSIGCSWAQADTLQKDGAVQLANVEDAVIDEIAVTAEPAIAGCTLTLPAVDTTIPRAMRRMIDGGASWNEVAAAFPSHPLVAQMNHPFLYNL
jgi:phage head maturation protease